MNRAITRLAATWIIGLVIIVALAPPALADAAGPTDYRTEIVSIEPATSAIRVTMIGGDAFISLEQIEPVEVIVVGYRGEDYLRFDPDGTVSENRRSPSAWLNQDRYGSGEPPSYTDHEAPPIWETVADNGRFAWHDHRSHWMNPTKPPGKNPGDQVLEQTVPMRLDGEILTVTVASYLLASPSWWPMILAAVMAVGIVASTSFSLNRVRWLAPIVVVAAWALVFGSIAFGSVPQETQPSSLLWLLPAIGLVAALGAIALRNRLATTVYLDGLAIVAGATVWLWGFSARSGALRRALIPSDAPEHLDRFGITLAILVGVAVVVRGFVGLLRPERLSEVTP